MGDSSQQKKLFSAEKRRLLSLLLAEEGVTPSARQDLLPRSQQTALPLSFEQESLYFLDQLESARAIYNNTTAIHLTGPLNIDVLERSFSEIVGRHEALRTTFVIDDECGNAPYQVIAPALVSSLFFTVKDLRLLPEDEREIEALRLANEEAQYAFDLARGPLIRIMLFELDKNMHILVIITHHIITDGLSLNTLLKELTALYTAYILNRSPALPELPIQYADFAIWQRSWLHDKALDKLLNYGRKQLQGAPVLLQLPTDRLRPSVQTYQGCSIQINIPASLTKNLIFLGRQEDATLFMVLLAAFQTLLYRYTGQYDIVVGSPIANRTHEKTSNMIGFFANMLLFRTNLRGSPPYRELLCHVRKVAVEAYANQELPFEQLVKALSPERNLSHNPIFQVAFVLQEHPLSYLQLPQVRVSARQIETGTSKFDLTLILEEMLEGGLSGRIEYSTTLFDAATIINMREQFQTLLESIVANPEQSIKDLPLLAREEQQRILFEWNMTQQVFPSHSCIHEIFERQSKLTPDAIAVECQGRQLTYSQLNEQANRLVGSLIQLGVEPEMPVGICVERSLELIIALLVILKAGGVYVPLDPTYPEERQAFILQDSQISVILTTQRYRKQLSVFPLQIVCLDTDEAILCNEQTITRPILAENLAYLMYTSGSTGIPKGVGVTHRNVVRLVKGVAYAELTTNEIFLQLAPLSFDASTFEIWGPLLNGGRLVIFPSDTPSLEEVSHVLIQNGITTLWLTSGLFHQMVEMYTESFQGLRQVLAGGDVVSAASIEKIFRRGWGVYVINGYGPTECTTFSCCFGIDEKTWAGDAVTVPIGRPIANARVYILDSQMQPVPVGISGELYIAGYGLARGYFGQPALTAECFIPEPFSQKPGERMYRTGDLARFKHDGNIEFLGRVDRQVKLRGFRIEPSEIEAVLARHPALQEVAVVVHERNRDNKQLLAYVVPVDSSSPPLVVDLHAYLQSKLPAYMLPSAFLFLDKLPLTQNGKIDLQALPDFEDQDTGEEAYHIEPRDYVEATVASIWAEVFQLERVGVHEDFFALGGHSLMAMRVLSRIYKAFNVELPMHCLFESPTVASLAQVLKRSQIDLTGPIQRENREKKLESF